MMKRWLLSLLVAFGLVMPVSALAIPVAPPLDRPIVDQTRTLNSQEISQLAAQITRQRGEKDYQIAVLMIPSLERESLEDYSINVARSWGIGEKVKNNGILFLIAKNDRRVRLEVGSGLEGNITDAQTGRIIEYTIAPRFRQNDFYGGISKGLDSIAALAQGKEDPHKQNSPGIFQTVINVLAFAIVPAIYLFLWLTSILARTKSWWAGGIVGGTIGSVIAMFAGWSLLSLIGLVAFIGGGLLLDYLVSHNYKQRKAHGENPSWWAGGTTLGGGGGSSGDSFGGGGFSGGGASGSW